MRFHSIVKNWFIGIEVGKEDKTIFILLMLKSIIELRNYMDMIEKDPNVCAIQNRLKELSHYIDYGIHHGLTISIQPALKKDKIAYKIWDSTMKELHVMYIPNNKKELHHYIECGMLQFEIISTQMQM